MAQWVRFSNSDLDFPSRFLSTDHLPTAELLKCWFSFVFCTKDPFLKFQQNFLLEWFISTKNQDKKFIGLAHVININVIFYYSSLKTQSKPGFGIDHIKNFFLFITVSNLFQPTRVFRTPYIIEITLFFLFFSQKLLFRLGQCTP